MTEKVDFLLRPGLEGWERMVREYSERAYRMKTRGNSNIYYFTLEQAMLAADILEERGDDMARTLRENIRLGMKYSKPITAVELSPSEPDYPVYVYHFMTFEQIGEGRSHSYEQFLEDMS